MNAVELVGVTKRFGDHVAVDDVTLTVPRGRVYGFIGPNGSGKTTSMRMIMNILRPDAGTVRVLGEAPDGASTDRVGYLPEERGLYRKMKVRELLLFYGRLKNGRDVAREVDRWLERFELGDWAGRKVDALSKGMSQKVQFIATVVSRPELLVLDEPFAGLDPVNAEVIREAVRDLHRDGATVILSTHDMAVAESMCDFIFMIFQGRKVLDGTLREIQDQHGRDRIRIEVEDGAPDLGDIAGVTGVRVDGARRDLSYDGGRDPQEILGDVLARTRVRSYEIARPSLHEIFVAIAAPEREEVADA
jgi:ABC-2 type transport system ATP-binding protein